MRGLYIMLACAIAASVTLCGPALSAEKWPLPQPVSVGSLQLRAIRWIDNGYNPVWAPDGSFLIFSRWHDGFFRCQADGSREVRLAKTDGLCDLSPDGKMVLYSAIHTSDAKGRKKRTARGIGLMKADGSDRWIVCEWGAFAKWSPDGRHFVCYGGRNPMRPGQPLFVYDHSGKLLRRLDQSGGSGAWWSANGKHLAYLGRDDTLYLSSGDGTLSREAGRLMEGGSLLLLWWSPKGQRLLYGRTGGPLFCLTPGTEPQTVSEHPAEWPVLWSPSGDRAVVKQAAQERNSFLLLGFEATGEPRVLFARDVGGYPNCCWSDDGAELLYQDGEKLQAVSADGAEVRTVGHPQSLSPTAGLAGRRYYLCSRWREQVNELWLLDAEDGSVSLIAPGYACWNARPAPGGRAITVWAKPGTAETKGWPPLLLFRVDRPR